MWWLALIAAFAGEHDAVAPTKVAVAAVDLPAGPAVTVDAKPGDDLAGLVAQLPPGSTLRLEPGDHDGPLVVDRTLTIEGTPGATLRGRGHGPILTIAAPNVRVRDLRVTHGGTGVGNEEVGVIVGGDDATLERLVVDDVYLGIDVRMAKRAAIRGCRLTGRGQAFGSRGDGIRLWEAYDSSVEDNTLTDVRDLVVWYSERNHIANNHVKGSRYGTHLMHASDNHIEGNDYEDDVVGVFVMYSDHIRVLGNTVRGSKGEAGMGIGFKESDDVEATNNRLVDDTTGIYIDGTPHRIGGLATFSRNVLAGDDTGLRIHGSQTGAVFTDNAFRANGVAVAVDGGSDATGSTFEHNQWSDYAGYDLDGDGTGDVPYVPRSLTGSLVDKRPDLAFFAGTPASALLDLFAMAFPMFAPKPVLVDPKPAMERS